MSEARSFSEDRERALTLARSGQYDDWQAICRKMLFDGWGVAIFNEVAFTRELEATCQRAKGRNPQDIQGPLWVSRWLDTSLETSEIPYGIKLMRR